MLAVTAEAVEVGAGAIKNKKKYSRVRVPAGMLFRLRRATTTSDNTLVANAVPCAVGVRGQASQPMLNERKSLFTASMFPSCPVMSTQLTMGRGATNRNLLLPAGIEQGGLLTSS